MVVLNDQLHKDLMKIVRLHEDQISVAAEGSDGFSFTYQAGMPMVSASLIKLPILLYAFKERDRYKKLFEHVVRFDDQQIVGGSGVLQILSSREWKLSDLLALMINVSDNTATNLMIDFFGISNLQNWVRDQGFLETKIERKLMDEAAQKEGRTNWISARDANRMIQQLFIGSGALPKEAQSWLLKQQFRYKLPGLFDEKDQPVAVYNKTGEMEAIDHDAGFFVYQKHSMAVTVMTSGFLNRQAALFAIQNIGMHVQNYLINVAQAQTESLE
ncbi:serine hydrolase [Sporolactobacillus terrae]|uniref:serine hydrolase n=1 Tax=Sporolactobacillus terrae TaxID=269673 RepID=UPI00056C32CB|nr:serine hydrolase [Sporolactobacillus terrae]